MSGSTRSSTVPAAAVEDAASAAPGPVRSARRGDIEGLRIVAVVLVAVYHYTQAGVSGGVDVFLFLSGYLVLGGLARRLGRAEAPRLGDFYRRTLRRLLPMSWLVAAVTVLVALAVARPGDLVGLGEQFLASLLYVENVWLADHQVAYGSSSTYLDPFQHFWSLSVQLQVFLVAPALLVLVVRAAALVRRNARPVLVPVGLLAAGSVATGWWLADRDQALAYFSTTARAWEFLLGALLAVLAPHVRLPRNVRTALGWTGLLALAVTGLLVDGAQEFPGPWALLPLLAAAAIVLAGADRTRFGVDRLLGSRPLAAAGRYAYALYLWHWPVMSLWLLGTGRPHLDLQGAVAVSLVTAGLTVASYHVVEQPLRRPLPEWTVRSRWLAGGLALALAGTGAVTSQAYRADVRWTAEVTAVAEAADLSTHPGAMTAYRPDEYPTPEGMLTIPLPQEGALDASAADTSCDVVGHEPGMWCLFDVTLGEGRGDTTITVLGGSHSAAWLEPTRLVADRLGWEARAYLRTGCPFVLVGIDEVADYYDPAWAPGCDAWNLLLMERLRAAPPDVVVTTYSRPFGPDGAPEWVPDAYVELWRELDELGIQVVAIRANARLPDAAPVCGSADTCEFPREEIYGPDDLLLRDDLPGNVHVLDVTTLACTDGVCPSVIGNVRVYADQTHLTNDYGRTAWPILRDFVEAELSMTVR